MKSSISLHLENVLAWDLPQLTVEKNHVHINNVRKPLDAPYILKYIKEFTVVRIIMYVMTVGKHLFIPIP